MKGIIFDLDGTMVNNMMVHHRAWQRKLKQLGMDLPIEEVMKRVHGVNEEILLRLFGDRFTLDERILYSKEKEAEYRSIFKSELKLIDGLPEFLQHAYQNNVPMGIGSAAPPENVDFVIDGLNIRYFFKTVKHARDVSKGKPDPEIYFKVAQDLNINPQDCIIFEDSPVGVEAAYRAGSQAVVVTTTHQPAEFARFPNVVMFISDFRQLDLTRLGLTAIAR